MPYISVLYRATSMMMHPCLLPQTIAGHIMVYRLQTLELSKFHKNTNETYCSQPGPPHLTSMLLLAGAISWAKYFYISSVFILSINNFHYISRKLCWNLLCSHTLLPFVSKFCSSNEWQAHVNFNKKSYPSDSNK